MSGTFSITADTKMIENMLKPNQWPLKNQILEQYNFYAQKEKKARFYIIEHSPS